MTARILLLEDELLTCESLVFAQNNSAQEWEILIFSLEVSRLFNLECCGGTKEENIVFKKDQKKFRKALATKFQSS